MFAPLSQPWLRPSSPSSGEFISTPKLLRWGPLIPLPLPTQPPGWSTEPRIPSGAAAGLGSCPCVRRPPSWTRPLGARRLLWDSWLQPKLFLRDSSSPSPSLPDPQDAVSEVEFGGFSQPGNKGQIQPEPAPCPGGSREQGHHGDIPVSWKAWDTLPVPGCARHIPAPSPHSQGMAQTARGRMGPAVAPSGFPWEQGPVTLLRVPPGLSPSSACPQGQHHPWAPPEAPGPLCCSSRS